MSTMPTDRPGPNIKVMNAIDRESPLENAFSRVRDKVNDMDNRIDALALRLDPILSQHYPTDCEIADPATSGSNSSYTNGLHEQADRLDLLVARVNILLTRLEV